ncbi:MAG: tetratricopeptide repeat protein [Prevotella sp.]|nr:tetratricopeptide repeat protein [Prevotella sp.]
MNLTELIQHPERMDRETLYDLRSLIALYPYHQTARLLMLQNLYLLHDATFDEELRRAAIYITDRKVLFQLIEAAHYKLRKQDNAKNSAGRRKDGENSGSRTTELIDNFLGSIPEEKEEKPATHRKPTPADATVDYVAYLIESSMAMDGEQEQEAPQMKGQSLIDDFISREKSAITLPDLRDEYPDEQQGRNAAGQENTVPQVTIYTETMAQIYVHQRRYSQALEIIKRLNLENPKKNAYFADQIRFLEKLIANNNNKKTK